MYRVQDVGKMYNQKCSQSVSYIQIKKVLEKVICNVHLIDSLF